MEQPGAAPGTEPRLEIAELDAERVRNRHETVALQ
jgi:hypothetical protein